jgi:uncharacterized protein YkwD
MKRIIILVAIIMFGSGAFAGYMGRTPTVIPQTKTVTVPSKEITVYDLWVDTNKLRTDPLVLDEKLNDTAQAKCTDMAKKNYWAHGDWTSFVFPLNRDKYGENLAYGQTTAQQVTDDWQRSPEHYKNIIDTGFHEVGFAVCPFRGTNLIVEHFSN